MLVEAAQEWIKALGHGEQIGRVAGRAETEDFLAAIDRIAALEHQADDAERALTADAVQHAARFPPVAPVHVGRREAGGGVGRARARQPDPARTCSEGRDRWLISIPSCAARRRRAAAPRKSATRPGTSCAWRRPACPCLPPSCCPRPGAGAPDAEREPALRRALAEGVARLESRDRAHLRRLAPSSARLRPFGRGDLDAGHDGDGPRRRAERWRPSRARAADRQSAARLGQLSPIDPGLRGGGRGPSHGAVRRSGRRRR